MIAHVFISLLLNKINNKISGETTSRPKLIMQYLRIPKYYNVLQIFPPRVAPAFAVTSAFTEETDNAGIE